MKILTGNANRPLANAIAEQLGLSLTRAKVTRFKDSEIWIEIEENVRGQDVFVVQPTSNPANEHLMELLITIDALKRGSARRITAVMPYYGYARQDRKSSPRSPISAKLIANLLTEAGADRVLTMELHAGQIQGFFDIPVDNLYAGPMFAKFLRDEGKTGEDVMMVSPDVGGVVRARGLAGRINAGLAIIDKRREEANKSEVMNIIGDVAGKHCVLFDDIVDTAGTLCNAADALIKAGAKSAVACVSHGVLSDPAIERITASDSLSEVIITDSIAATDSVKNCAKVRTISIATLMAEAILRISSEQSVSSLFD